MNKDQINLQEVYSRIYLKEDENFSDQINPSAQERAESVYGEEIPPVEGESEELGEDSNNSVKMPNRVAHMVKVMKSKGESSDYVTGYLMSMIQNTIDVPNMPSLQDQIDWAINHYEKKTLPEEDETQEKMNEDSKSGSYTLYYKDPEAKKTSAWYTSETLEDLVNQVNKGNKGMDYDLPVVDEDRVFKNKEELLDFCSHSDFFIKGPDGNLVSGYPVKPGDWENDINEKKEKFTINTPTQGQLISKTRAPVHKPTMQIKPKKGIYNRQQFKKDYE